MAPSAHVTVPPAAEHVPWLVVAETKARFDGRVSVSVTPVAAPRLPTPIEKVNGWLTAVELVEAVCETDTSTWPTWVTTDEALSPGAGSVSRALAVAVFVTAPTVDGAV